MQISKMWQLVTQSSMFLRYDLIDRPGVLGNYVPLNYHCLYDLSVLVEDFMPKMPHANVGVSRVYTQGRNCPKVKHECYKILSIKSYLNSTNLIGLW